MLICTDALLRLQMVEQRTLADAKWFTDFGRWFIRAFIKNRSLFKLKRISSWAATSFAPSFCWGSSPSFHLPRKDFHVENLNDLFKGVIDWDLIRLHLPDMLRIAISVSRGRVAPSTILRRLNSAGKKNKLYFAFRELGRACRTSFLLQYISNIDLRYRVQGATNVSEAWNGFTQWVAFGSNRLRKTDRAGQTKIIRYNHLVANLIVLYNTVQITECLDVFALQGALPEKEILTRLSPYITENINRFGEYELVD